MSTEGLEYKSFFTPAPPRATSCNLRTFFCEEAKSLSSAFGFKNIADIMQKEEAEWQATWQRNPAEALALYRREREMRCILNELLWAVVKKHGCEIRLGAKDLAPLGWQLIETFDIKLGEKILRAETESKEEPCPE